MSLYLLIITQNRENNIKQLVSNLYPTFDGIISCVHKPLIDNTYNILLQNQKNGITLTREFFPYHHSHSMNELFFCRKMKNGDFALILDSPERISLKLINEIKNITVWMKNNDVGCIYGDERPYIINYYDTMFFNGNPHWNILGNFKKSISWTKEEKESYIINTRHEEPWKSFCLNPIKYWFCYSAQNNESYMIYFKYGEKIVQKHEKIRQEFRLYCEFKLNLSLNSLDDLIEYMKKIERKEIVPDEYFVDIVENEFRLSELFQLMVLNMNFMGERPNCVNGMHPRYKWSFRDFIFHGNGFYNPDYEGTILKYEKGIFN